MERYKQGSHSEVMCKKKDRPVCVCEEVMHTEAFETQRLMTKLN